MFDEICTMIASDFATGCRGSKMNRSWIISILIVALIVGSSYVGFSTDERDRNVSKESDIGYGGGKEESTLAGSRAGESTTIVITEMCGSPDFCEMVNVGRGPITITGWKLHGYDEGS